MTGLSRRQLVQGAGAVGLGLLAGCGRLPWPGQQAKLPVVGFLTGLSQSEAQVATEAFWQGLRDLGYAEGQDIVVEYRFADGRNERLPDVANELVGLQVSSILAVGPPASHAARAATATIPIVVTSTDPVGEGLVASLARPGGNVTGLSYGSALIAGKKLELLKEVAPLAGRVVALWYAPNVGSAFQLKELQDAAPRLGLQLHPVGVQDADDFEAAFQSVATERADALFLIDGPEMFPRRMRILEFASGARLPTMYSRREYVESGGLMAYGVSFPALWRRTAYYVDRILKGARPADLPIEEPMRFDFVINLKTAQALGLTIPPHVLLQATEVIQ